jgi:hypothetical protein
MGMESLAKNINELLRRWEGELNLQDEEPAEREGVAPT